MATIIGDLLVWFLGNPDLLKLLAAFTIGIGLIHTAFAIWHHYNEGRG